MKKFKLIFTVLLFVFLITLPGFLLAQNGYKISGTVSIQKTNGDVFVSLVDEESNNEPLKGIKKAVLKPNSKTLSFKFENIPPGVYALKCFQDTNGNEKLDMGMFGPKEPWYLSWQKDKRFPPRWEDYSFELKKDMSFKIELKY
jgi:uncharacterized protein (DUF2141 family)